MVCVCVYACTRQKRRYFAHCGAVRTNVKLVRQKVVGVQHKRTAYQAIPQQLHGDIVLCAQRMAQKNIVYD